MATEKTNWKLCILCQEHSTEELVCPLDNPVAVRRQGAYRDIINLVCQFREVDAAPHPKLKLPEEECMRTQRASWHKLCRQMHKLSALDRAKGRQLLPPARKILRRTSTSNYRNVCIFCGDETHAADHSFQKLSLTKDIHDKAVLLGDNRIVACLAEGDLVAIEAKYHRNCYTGFNRRYRQMIKSKEQGKAENMEVTIENELLQFVNEEIAGGRRIFPLQDLTDMMTERLEQHGSQKVVNRTFLKERVLEHFSDLTEEKGIRDRVYLVCSETARKIISGASQTLEEESRTLLLAASILRKAVLDHDTSFNFKGSFPQDCEELAVPTRVKYFFRQLLAGPKSSPTTNNSRKVISVSQLAMLNMSSLSANLKCEPPLAVFLALQLHSQTRSKKVVELLHDHCLSVSYKRVLNIEASFAAAVAKQTRVNNNVVCPTNLRKNIFTVATLDNLDHNPTSRTANTSFHGTGISIFQFPSKDKPRLSQEQLQTEYGGRESYTKGPILPTSYTFVPPVARNLVTQPPVRDVHSLILSSYPEEEQHEQEWMAIVHDDLNIESETDTVFPIMRSSYHASKSDAVGSSEKCIEALLLLFHDKAATEGMIRHGMQLVKQTTEYLNAKQTPILVVDKPLYDIAKKIQWTFAEMFGEDKFLVMLRGLHIEMALWATMGDLLLESGWPEVLVEAGIAKTLAAATSFLKVCNPIRTRYAHQITVVVLDYLLKRAYEKCGIEMTFQSWISLVSKNQPTVKFWLLIHKYEQILFMFIRAHRERKFKLMDDTLQKLVPLFFALDHHNYARWVPVFIRDLQTLPEKIQEEFEAGHWVVTRSNHRFSSIPIDQAHEQANKRVKGVGGMIGLTELLAILERWIATGPEISRAIEQFTSASDDADDDKQQRHHEEGLASQFRFKRHVADLLDIMLSRGNPFEENSTDLVTLDNKVCINESASASVLILECMGLEQYENFKRDVFCSNKVLLTAPIKKNNYLLFHKKKTTTKISVTRKILPFKQHADQYGQAFVVLDSRGGNLEEFFRHESSQFPPALSSNGSLNSCCKSHLLPCLVDTCETTGHTVDEELIAPDVYGVIVIDGGALIHSLPGTSFKGMTFYDYFRKVLLPRIQHYLQKAERVDIVWDQYRAMTIKGPAREKRGIGTRQRVSRLAKVPGKWHEFLADENNKKELFSLLSTELMQVVFHGKLVYITSNDQVLTVGHGPPMGPCNHEEADTRILVHLLHALKGSSLAMVYTGDTAVVVILLTNFHHLIAVNPLADIWISFKVGKTTKLISLNIIAASLGVTTCKAMALFHAFTGSDSTSSFKFKGKRYCFKTKDKVPSLMEEFSTAVSAPFHISQKLRDVAMQFACSLYSNEFITANCNIDLIRMQLFCQKTRDVERIPPTSDAFDQYLKRSMFQASIWTTAHEPLAPVEIPANHGWMEKDGKLVPIWTTSPLAKNIFDLNIKCVSTKNCSSCKCMKAKLKCTRLCQCKCDK